MTAIKTIYFEDELIKEVLANSSAKNFSERVKELIRKGLAVEEKGEDLSFRDHLEWAVKRYNEKAKKPIYVFPNKDI